MVRTSSLLTGFERILQTDTSVEYQMIGAAVLAVGAEVAETHELEGIASLGILQRSFYLTAGEHFQRIGVQACQKILASCIGIGIVE